MRYTAGIGIARLNSQSTVDIPAGPGSRRIGPARGVMAGVVGGGVEP
ncbi:hypothetical protein NLX83_24155 [Allokutzneria sp. A3M-2-11 16]|nr:hypothetical protein [Allokutzneria sp. A3M-2-11 16]MCP3802366.1 hypothetical protein [Allokutzneria sp. A3M-2-11 16]